MGGVIRREHLATAGTFSFQDVEREAAEILAGARAQAARSLADAEVRARELAEVRQREAYERGLAAGRQAGLERAHQEARQAARQAAQAEMARLTQALTTGLAEYERNRHNLLARAESGLIELAAAIARRVCKITIDASSEAVRANARALLEMVEHQGDLELHVHPAEADLLRDVAEEFTQHIAALGHVTLKADTALARGDCRLHTRDGMIDAAIARQLDRIAEAICTSVPTTDAAGAELPP